MTSRPLSPEEAALWQRLIATVKPLDDGSRARVATQNRPHRQVKLSRHVQPSDPEHSHLGDTPEARPLAPTQQDFARLLDAPRRSSAMGKPVPVIQQRGYSFQPASQPSRGNLDGHWERRLGKGLVTPDMTVDLHEHSLADAYARMDRALADAQARGARVLLLITGKARPAAHDDGHHGRPRGAIRRAMQDWLMASRHAGDIAAVRNAHPRHGADGALYIILKKRRR
ncbi:MAG: Smr/MutS family protein [Pseudomonadota bacterium]